MTDNFWSDFVRWVADQGAFGRVGAVSMHKAANRIRSREGAAVALDDRYDDSEFEKILERFSAATGRAIPVDPPPDTGFAEGNIDFNWPAAKIARAMVLPDGGIRNADGSLVVALKGERCVDAATAIVARLVDGVREAARRNDPPPDTGREALLKLADALEGKAGKARDVAAAYSRRGLTNKAAARGGESEAFYAAAKLAREAAGKL